MQRPSGESIPARAKGSLDSVDSTRFTPPASASVDSPSRRLWHAACTATSDDEHAVSMARLGPRRSRQYDKRLATMLPALPVAEYTLSSLPARSCRFS
ncbi:hypothetical protein RPSA_47770 (plasmid) [Ralstonia solanacearum]|nr:hypothetical protein RPSA_47770 [Ralstonia solanacearum]